jgi:enoyl-CoA hydratase/3-hydroxyacyl-CoA dehydrogenase
MQPLAGVCSQDNVERLLAGNSPQGVPEDLAARVAKFIGYKAPIALKIANEIIDQQAEMSMEEAIELELDRLKDIFSTDDALLGLSNIGRRVEFKGK